MSRRVVITGLGLVTSLGCDYRLVWNSFLKGKSGIAPIRNFDASQFDVRFGGEVKKENFQPQKWIKERDIKRLDPFGVFALYAAHEAVADAGIDFGFYDRWRVGAIIASGIGGVQELEAQHKALLEKGPHRVSPFMIPKLMMNALGGQIAIEFGLRGANYAVTSACASANHAIGLAYQAIRTGTLDAALTGGSEAALSPIGLAGFCSLRALSRRNDAPEEASRPFEKNRDGFVMAEGAGIVLLEEYELAKKREAPLYAEVLGFGMTCDAFHITAPEETGEGAARAMQMAIEDAKLDREKIDYINAHGTSTPYNDATETRAIKTVFGSHAKKLAINSTKSMIGHTLGAAAGIEAIVCALSLKHQVLHPTINYHEPDPECDLYYVPNEAVERPIRYALSNAFGFGGHNTALLLGKV